MLSWKKTTCIYAKILFERFLFLNAPRRACLLSGQQILAAGDIIALIKEIEDLARTAELLSDR